MPDINCDVQDDLNCPKFDSVFYGWLNTLKNKVYEICAKPSGLSSCVTFSSDGVWTVPDGITSALVEVTGGGGGGAGGQPANSLNGWYGGGGGGQGGRAKKLITGLVAGQNIAVTVGVGGAGAAGELVIPASIGTGGTTSSFGSFLSATGGQAGANFKGGGGGFGVGGCSNYGGQAGTNSVIRGGVPYIWWGGNGGGGRDSGGGGFVVNDGGTGLATGGGGAGGSARDGTVGNGGDGANGSVVVYF